MTTSILKLLSKPEPCDVDCVLDSLRNTYPGTVESSCDLLGLMRNTASPNLSIVQFEECVSRSGDDLEEALRTSVQRCMEFLSTHQYSLYEVYGDFEDLIKEIPDPREQPMALLNDFLLVLREYGCWAAERAALLLCIKIEKLKTREKYERHFLLLSVIYTEMTKVRKLCDDAFSGLTDLERLTKHSKPKLLKLIEVILQYKPEHIAGPSGSQEEKAEGAETIKNEPESETGQEGPVEAGEKEIVLEPVVEKDTSSGDAGERVSGDAMAEKEPTGGNIRHPRGRGHRRRGGGHSSYDNPNGLCGVIFVHRPFHAKVVYHFLKDLSRSDDAYSFLNPQYFALAQESETETEKKKQEDALRRFRIRGTLRCVCVPKYVHCA